MGLQFESGPAGTGTKILPQFPKVRFKHRTRALVLQLSEHSFSVSTLPPYQGWEVMRTDALAAWRHAEEVLQPVAIRRLGVRYPAVALTGEFLVAYPFIAVTVAVLGLYTDMSLGEFLRIFLVFAALQLIYTGLVARRIQREVVPVTTWLEGNRGERETLSAWHAAASRDRSIGMPLRRR